MNHTAQGSPHRFEHLGCSFAYGTAGDGEPVLFIQGTAVHGDGWRPQVEGLAARFTCAWFDNRGMFASRPAGEAPISVPQMADDSRALLDHLGWDRAHVVGHSLGGCIALQLALGSRDRVRTLSLLCTSSDGAALATPDLAGIWRGIRSQVGTLRSRRRAFLENVLSPVERAGADLDEIALELESIFGHDLAVLPPGTMKQVKAMRDWNVTARLGELEGVPSLVVGGEYDPIVRPDLVRALAATIPRARLEMLDDAAHGIIVTRAAQVNVLLQGQFERG